jgi:hypothetical protein
MENEINSRKTDQVNLNGENNLLVGQIYTNDMMIHFNLINFDNKVLVLSSEIKDAEGIGNILFPNKFNVIKTGKKEKRCKNDWYDVSSEEIIDKIDDAYKKTIQ